MKMKKSLILLIAASLSSMLSFSSCEKSSLNEANQDRGELKINIDISDIGMSPETRAAKTGWAAGDKLNLWFDDWNYIAQVENHIPDLVLTYDGSSWNAGSLAEGRTLKASGKFCVVYEGYNDLSKYTYQWYLGGEWFHPNKVYDQVDHEDCYCVPLTLYNENISYSFSSNTLTASISSWSFKTLFKVLIKNDNGTMSGNAGDYILQVQNITTSEYINACGAVIINAGPTCPEIRGGSSNYIGKAGGVQEADGTAFYFGGFKALASDNIKFTLQKGSAKRSYTVTGKVVATSANKCINVAMNYSNFAAE